MLISVLHTLWMNERRYSLISAPVRSQSQPGDDSNLNCSHKYALRSSRMSSIPSNFPMAHFMHRVLKGLQTYPTATLINRLVSANPPAWYSVSYKNFEEKMLAAARYWHKQLSSLYVVWDSFETLAAYLPRLSFISGSLATTGRISYTPTPFLVLDSFHRSLAFISLDLRPLIPC